MPVAEEKEQQRKAALNKANAYRSQKKQYKEKIKAGTAQVSAIIRNPPAFCASAEALHVLTWAPGIGKTKARSLVRRLNISPTLTLGTMSKATRERLADAADKAQRTLA